MSIKVKLGWLWPWQRRADVPVRPMTAHLPELSAGYTPLSPDDLADIERMRATAFPPYVDASAQNETPGTDEPVFKPLPRYFVPPTPQAVGGRWFVYERQDEGAKRLERTYAHKRGAQAAANRLNMFDGSV